MGMFYCVCSMEDTLHSEEVVVIANGQKRIKGKCGECGSERFLPENKKPEECIFYFGKHRGKNLLEVPKDYLSWCLDKDLLTGKMAIEACKILGRERYS